MSYMSFRLVPNSVILNRAQRGSKEQDEEEMYSNKIICSSNNTPNTFCHCYSYSILSTWHSLIIIYSEEYLIALFTFRAAVLLRKVERTLTLEIIFTS